jgi:hypothetical protein
MDRENFNIKMEYYVQLYFNARLLPRKKKKSERNFIIKLMVILDSAFRYSEEREMVY